MIINKNQNINSMNNKYNFKIYKKLLLSSKINQINQNKTNLLKKRKKNLKI